MYLQSEQSFPLGGVLAGNDAKSIDTSSIEGGNAVESNDAEGGKMHGRNLRGAC